MLLTQMWTSVSSRRGPRGPTGCRRRTAQPSSSSFIRFSDVERSRPAASPVRRRGRARRSITVAMWSTHFCMKPRPHGSELRVGAQRNRRPARAPRGASRTSRRRRFDADAPHPRVQSAGGCAPSFSSVESASTITRSSSVQQHRVLGREIEVERRAGKARRPWPGRRPRCRRTGAASSNCSAVVRMASSRSSPDGRAERRPLEAAAGADGRHLRYFTRC